MNAILGVVRPGDMGVDLMHYNCAQDLFRPARRRRAGSRPDRRPRSTWPYLPAPLIARRDDGTYRLDYDRPKSIGRVRSFFGNTGILFRAYCYIMCHGPDGLKGIAQHAVLNANYLMSLVRDVYPVTYGDSCMHEFVASARPLAKERGIRAMDIAKRLIDFNFHAPTVYFPLIVPEAMMVEPTETESRETLEAFAKVLSRSPQEDPRDAPRRPAQHADQPARRGQGGQEPGTRMEARVILLCTMPGSEPPGRALSIDIRPRV